MDDLKKGDIVWCIDNSSMEKQYILGGVYIVEEIDYVRQMVSVNGESFPGELTTWGHKKQYNSVKSYNKALSIFKSFVHSYRFTKNPDNIKLIETKFGI